MRALACFAVEWPEARAECAIGETSLVADTLQDLAVALLKLGAPDNLVLIVRVVGRMESNPDRLVNGYSVAAVRAFAEGKEVPIDTNVRWGLRSAWMKEFGE